MVVTVLAGRGQRPGEGGPAGPGGPAETQKRWPRRRARPWGRPPRRRRPDAPPGSRALVLPGRGRHVPGGAPPAPSPGRRAAPATAGKAVAPAPRRPASGAGAADAPRRRRRRRPAYGFQRQPARWPGIRTGRPPVKMAARPVVTWSKRVGSSPSRQAPPPPRSFSPGPCSRRRRGRCRSAAPRCAGCRRRGRRGRGGPCRSAGALRTPRALRRPRPTRSRGRAASRPMPGSRPGRWRRRRRRRWCRSGLLGQWGSCIHLKCDVCPAVWTPAGIQRRSDPAPRPRPRDDGRRGARGPRRPALARPAGHRGSVAAGDLRRSPADVASTESLGTSSSGPGVAPTAHVGESRLSRVGRPLVGQPVRAVFGRGPAGNGPPSPASRAGCRGDVAD